MRAFARFCLRLLAFINFGSFIASASCCLLLLAFVSFAGCFGGVGYHFDVIAVRFMYFCMFGAPLGGLRDRFGCPWGHCGSSVTHFGVL